MNLFPRDLLPPKQRRKLMKVVDASIFGTGELVRMACPHCGHDEGWKDRSEPHHVLKRGLPCPKCNEQEGSR